ncbi:MAG: phosphoribosylamine--glycine ligase, partial [Bacteroidota bacterium]|nr:phosphoribosylamine--glycine ligase [Bacteroidota bacterium]
ESSRLSKLFISPGNPGTSSLGENVRINLNDHKSLINFCKTEKIELVVVGPEIPLVAGVADILRAAGIKVFGPSAGAAAIEGEKSFAKNLMRKYNIPTAAFIEFTDEQTVETLEYLRNTVYPLVIKADGLAAGKGVVICNNYSEAETAVIEIFNSKIFGSAGRKIVIEEFMTGEEASIFAVTDGKDFICLPAAQDHKRAGDNDTGKNTGGMGAYAPAALITDELLTEIETKIIAPVIDAMKLEGVSFCGCLYCGLMITSEGPKVVEFNCRFGDPETQVVLPLLKGDFLELLYSAAQGKLNKNAVTYNGGAAVCVILASKGYPDEYLKGYEIHGLNKIPKGTIAYHSGTIQNDKKIFTNGGRVLGITAITENNDLKAAQKNAYEAVSLISYDNIYFRSDIAGKGINRI